MTRAAFSPLRDRGQVLTDMAIMLASGEEATANSMCRCLLLRWTWPKRPTPPSGELTQSVR